MKQLLFSLVIAIVGVMFFTQPSTSQAQTLKTNSLISNYSGPIKYRYDTIAAPCPAKIVRILVKEGDKVNMGEDLVDVEAMNTIFPWSSPIKGEIASIRVSVNDVVETRQVIMLMKR